MHPRQASLLAEAASTQLKTAASVLWKYTDGEGKVFYLEEKKATLRSPYDGKSMTAKPERMSMSDLGKDMKGKQASDDDADGWKIEAARKKRTEQKVQAVGVLWQYTDPNNGKSFWLPEKKTRVFSPWDGKSFSAKPERDTLSEVAKDVKEDAAKTKDEKNAGKGKKAADEASSWKAPQAIKVAEDLSWKAASEALSWKAPRG